MMPKQGGHRVKVADIEMYYERSGEGFPLLMIMGLGANLDWWDPREIEELSRRFETITFDNRGTGRTGASDKEFTIRLFADDAAGLMDALGIPKAHVLGISMGGMIAQELALNYPEKVERLVLCSTNCGGRKSIPASPETLGRLMGAGGAGTEEGVARGIVPQCFTRDFAAAHKDEVDLWIGRVLEAPTSSDTFLRQVHAIAGFDTYDRLRGIKIPTLVLHGRQDVLIPPENASVLAEAMPQARLVILEHSAHGLSEDLDDMIHATTEFLRASG